VQNGDIILIDAVKRILEVKISEEEISKRRATWVKPAPRATSGVLYKYMKLVSSASEGCVTDN